VRILIVKANIIYQNLSEAHEAWLHGAGGWQGKGDASVASNCGQLSQLGRLEGGSTIWS
jgi:hypothetical protein